MAAEMLSVTTPMGADPNRGPIPFTALHEDLDGDGVPERIEIEDEPRLSGSPFREWRVYRRDGTVPITVAAGVEIGVRYSESGAPVLVSDEAFWRFAVDGRMYPYGDLVLTQAKFMMMGTREDRDLLDAYGAPGVFLDNVRTIAVALGGGRGKHRVITCGGYAFMNKETTTFPFIITDHLMNVKVAGNSIVHPWLFRNGSGFTLISDDIFGHQITILPEGAL